MPIQVLPPEVVARIAAGEVVERPASVVKELVENSLDAGARQIQVELRNGGLQLIRVVDDGCGIPADELPLAFLRHATSKISSVSDLDRISTLGFRGEALASIAAAARVQVISRPCDADCGRYISLEDGAILEFRPISSPPGTSITVRNLFYNLPARRKFLRSPATEAAQVAHLLGQYALAYPEVKFSLVIDGRPCFESVGGRLLDVLAMLYGPELARAMIPLETVEESDGISEYGLILRGYVSPPNISRPNRQAMSFFVNRRWVRSPLLAKAVEDAYRTLLPTGRFPVVVLHLSIDVGEVDVNIHPAKLDIRFRHERMVERQVREAVACTLANRLAIPSLERYPYKPIPGMQRQLQIFERRGEWVLPEESGIQCSSGAGKLPSLRVLGQLNQSYIVAEGADGMYLISQHRAHERIIYERLLEQMGENEITSQLLLEGFVLDLSPGWAAMLSARLPELAEAGIVLEPFGSHSFLIRAIPSILRQEPAIPAIVAEVVEQVLTDPQANWQDRLLAALACRSAVKAGQRLSLAELRELVRQLEQTQLPTTCPHANPIIAYLSNTELERQFGRR